MSLPKEIRKQVSDVLWGEADRLDWASLSPQEKTKWYSAWTSDARIGGRLSRYMTVAGARLFIKDALMKEYNRNRQSDATKILVLLELPANSQVLSTFTRPAGIELEGHRLISWGRAITWKLVLLSCFERSYSRKGSTPFAVVLTDSARHFGDASSKAPVTRAAELLGIKKVVWSSR